MHFTGLPFDDIRHLITTMKPLLVSEGDELARFSHLFRSFSGKKLLLKPFCVLFYSTNNRFNLSPETAKAKLKAASDGSAKINKLCAHYDIGLKAFDLAIDYPSGILSEQECAATIAYGMEALAGEPDLVILSGYNEGISQIAAEMGNDLEALRTRGTRDIAAILGAIIAARLQNVPVIVDGEAGEKAVSIIKSINQLGADHVIIARDYAQEEGISGVLKAGLLKASLVIC